MHNRREPINKDRVIFIQDKDSSMSSVDNLYTIVGDWITQGL